jgi:hypothetical protein
VKQKCFKGYTNEIRDLEETMLQLFCAHTEKRTTLKLLDMNQEVRSRNRMFVERMGDGVDDMDFFKDESRNIPYVKETEFKYPGSAFKAYMASDVVH